MSIIAAQHDIIDTRSIIKYRDTLLNKYRNKRYTSFYSKSPNDHHIHPPNVDILRLNLAYRKIDQLIQKRQKSRRSYRSRMKYSNPLL
jgi:hypothetical protein